jgi:predicted nucleic acid-binding protein
VLDTGALIALERNDRRTRQLVLDASSRGVLVVPVLVAMEALFGAGSSARIRQVLAAIDMEVPLLPEAGHQAVGLRVAAGTGSDADACVVVEALAVPGSAIVTDDAKDMGALLAAAGATGRVPLLRCSG